MMRSLFAFIVTALNSPLFSCRAHVGSEPSARGSDAGGVGGGDGANVTLGQRLCLLIIMCIGGSAVVSCAASGQGGDFDAGPGDDAARGGDDSGPIISSGDGGGCVPSMCADLGYDCGLNNDGCGGVLDCGSCPAGQFCGNGGYRKCGYRVTADDGGRLMCSAKTCGDLGFDCGPAGDGCGGALDCGTCTVPQYCGANGHPSICGGNSGRGPDGGIICQPKTCTDWGYNCGPAGDGCGGALSCGGCTGGTICGGVMPSVRGGGAACTGLCTQQVQCDGEVTTTVSGRVLAGVSAWTGLSPDPVPNVLVFVPNARLASFAGGTACRQCGADVSGSPLVSTYTDFDGTFTLTNVPAGNGIPLVIQLGRWRREFVINAPQCATTPIGDFNLPRNQGEGTIPLTAVSTGDVDALECVLLKMGVDQTEFTPDNGTGRIHLYSGDPAPHGGNPGATAGAGTRNEPALMDTGGTVMNYDQVMLPCWGSPNAKSATELADLISYADSGGHFFATHYAYPWLVGNGEFNNVATWVPNFNNPQGVTWTFNVSTTVPPSPPAPRVETFAKWLNLVQALSNRGATVPANPQVSIYAPRDDANAVANGSVNWIDGTDPQKGNAMVEHFTFDTPVAAATKCGHAIFSDFHVADSHGYKKQFPAECTTTFTAQERILEYMIWDLSSCAPPPPPPSCAPRTCAQQSIGCGPAGDGCGGPLDCGPCSAPFSCGGGGVPGQCGMPPPVTCTPLTCAEQKISCGPAGDGCGGPLDCGPCTPLCTDRAVSTEPEILIGYQPGMGQTVGLTGQIKVWVCDEFPPFIAPGEQVDNTTGAITTPGNRTAIARDGLLYEPALYIAPQTPTNGGTPHFPQWIKGSYNNKGLSGGAPIDPPPPGTTLGTGGRGPGGCAYKAEYIWDVSTLGLGPGSYDAMFSVHDGDNDRAIGCVNIVITP